MKLRNLLSTAAVAALLALAAPAAAEAQLGNLRRAGERAAERALRPESSAPERSATTGAASQPAAGSSVIEMNGEVLDRFTRALATEDADRREVARLLDPGRMERYQQCATAAMMTEEAQRATEEFSIRSEDLEGEAAVRAMADYRQAIQRLMEQRCGPQPQDDRGDLERRPARTAATTGGFTEQQYAVLKERVVPFCRTSAEAGSDGGARLGGQGRNIFYVYNATEVAALRPRCGSLMPLLQAVL